MLHNTPFIMRVKSQLLLIHLHKRNKLSARNAHLFEVHLCPLECKCSTLSSDHRFLLSHILSRAQKERNTQLSGFRQVGA